MNDDIEGGERFGNVNSKSIVGVHVGESFGGHGGSFVGSGVGNRCAGKDVFIDVTDTIACIEWR